MEITVYGTQNNPASDLLNCIVQYSVNNPDTFGLMNMPIIRDCKRTQKEMLSIAMKKKISFRVSYYQVRIAQIARVYIETCLPTFQFIEGTLPGNVLVTQENAPIVTQNEGEILTQ